MHDAALVRRLDRFRDLPGDRQRLVEGERACAQPLLERRPVDELEDEREDAVRLLDAVDRRDVRVVERGEQLRLALEAGEPLRVGANRLRQHLDRHLAPQARVARAVDLTHPPGAEGSEDLIGAEAVSGS
jgi:hypothetical protein